MLSKINSSGYQRSIVTCTFSEVILR